MLLPVKNKGKQENEKKLRARWQQFPGEGGDSWEGIGKNRELYFCLSHITSAGCTKRVITQKASLQCQTTDASNPTTIYCVPNSRDNKPLLFAGKILTLVLLNEN